MKHLKTNFCNLERDNKSQPTEKDFLKYYFEECANKNNNPVDFYEDPLIRKYRKRKSRKKEINYPKSINTRFLSLIFQSNKFYKDFIDYLDNKLFFESLREVPDKFFLIFSNYLNCEIKEAAEYFLKNKRCKLPWSYYEIAFAIKAFKNIIKEVRNE